MYLMIDNYDSFVYNLSTYFTELNQKIILRRNDEITLKEISDMLNSGLITAIIISPGPKRPNEAGICQDIIWQFQGSVPILGVCLGHQVIGSVYGATVQKGIKPSHGKVTEISHNNSGLFRGLPNPYKVTRYHSLVVNPKTLSSDIQIDATCENQTVMALSHKKYPIYGVQFHPEAILTENGYALLENFILLTEEWQKNNGQNHKKAQGL
ncbi:MAG: aminodeoxychorismate/anthranilate synthase component II [Clostridiales bacterium]